MSKRAKWKILQHLRIGHQLLQVRRLDVVRRDLHHVGRAVAGRQLHDAERDRAWDRGPMRFGVDRDGRCVVARQIGKIATVQANGHGDVLGRQASLVIELRIIRHRSTWSGECGQDEYQFDG